MAKVQSPSQLKEYAYRKLGSPKVTIQVDDTQAYDRIEDAVDLFVERHYDGTTEEFIAITFTADDETNQYLTLPDDVLDVTRIYEGSRYSAEAMSDIRYRIMMDEVFDATNVNMQYYEMTMQHMELISSYFAIDRLFTFNNATHRLYPTTGKIIEGNSMLIRAYRATSPDTDTGYAVDLYNDEWIKRYATALIKQQWGANMKPFDGMPLPGGITVNGQQVWDEATEEIQRLEEEIIEDELPVDFIVG